MSLPTVALLTAIHRRHPVALRCLERWRRLSFALDDVCRLVRVAAVSEEDAVLMPILDRTGVSAVIGPNRPVSLKWQRGLDHARRAAPDAAAVLITGSDDWITEPYLRRALGLVLAGKSRGCGPDVVWALDQPTGFLGCVRGPMHLGAMMLPFGAGRVIGRAALEAVGWRLWTEPQDESLDTAASRRLAAAGIWLDVLWTDGVPGAAVLDVKDGANIHAWTSLPFAQVLAPGPAAERVRRWGLEDTLRPGDSWT